MLDQLFGVRKPVIGMVHLLALPGSPGYSGNIRFVIDAALRDAEILQKGGVDGILVENAGDAPFLIGDQVGPATVAAMTAAAEAIRNRIGLPMGISCASNAVCQALAVAVATQAVFVRATGWVNAYIGVSGLIQAAAPAALRYRLAIGGTNVRIFADVKVKNGAHQIVSDKTLAEMCADARSAGADAVIATGRTSGDAPNLEELSAMRRAAGIPLLAGSGCTTANVHQILEVVDGIIVGSYLKEGGKMSAPVDLRRVQEFMGAVRRAR